MNITVIVCTYNRCQTVTKSLDSIAVQNVPEFVEWNVLVVDNNSTDQTREVLEKYCIKNPRFSYVFESKQGLSHARNAGIQKASGQILAFTDDDVTADPDWLWSLTSSLNGGEWSFAGGRIIPVWPGRLPDWLSEDDFATMGPFTGFDEGPEAKRLTRPTYGGNTAFRREIFEKYGCFRTDLGRSSNNLLGREDIEIANRLFAAGERLRYEPNAVIRHPVEEYRMTKRYVLKWAYWDSRSEIADTGPPETRWSIKGVPLSQFRRVVRWAFQWAISTNPRSRFFCQLQMWKVIGTAVACYRESGRGVRQPSAASRVTSE
ncbi:glycosyltransferase family 2 protein [Telmatobacter sp. DSM 110680]|uniref:Glycosyltransferase family 2 protein n=1 Tax=Telmatobacter sp. DSM 110680 TaxID=3036704 RepID=A0AAU7DE77_9BACT